MTAEKIKKASEMSLLSNYAVIIAKILMEGGKVDKELGIEGAAKAVAARMSSEDSLKTLIKGFEDYLKEDTAQEIIKQNKCLAGVYKQDVVTCALKILKIKLDQEPDSEVTIDESRFAAFSAEELDTLVRRIQAGHGSTVMSYSNYEFKAAKDPDKLRTAVASSATFKQIYPGVSKNSIQIEVFPSNGSSRECREKKKIGKKSFWAFYPEMPIIKIWIE